MRKVCTIIYIMMFASVLNAQEASHNMRHNMREYVEVICPETEDEAAIGEALRGAGIDLFWGESTAWALLNDFDTILKIPLDEYHTRVLPFDPRNDGYAENARAFFVRGGERHLFIPVTGTASSTARTVSRALGEIEGLDFHIAAYSPAQAGGPSAGSRAASPLAGLFAALTLFILLFQYVRRERGREIFPLKKHALAAKSVLIHALILAAAFLVIPALLGSPFPIQAAVLLFAAFLAAARLFFAEWRVRETGHRRFSPVFIIPPGATRRPFSWKRAAREWAALPSAICTIVVWWLA